MTGNYKLNEEYQVSQYEVVANRRVAGDSLLWQAPVLSLTAQAFLLTIALGNSDPQSVFISSLLGAITALASIHLMWKHRYFELRDSMWLERVEIKLQIAQVHRRPKIQGAFTSSYNYWILMLAAFGTAASWAMKAGIESLWPGTKSNYGSVGAFCVPTLLIFVAVLFALFHPRKSIIDEELSEIEKSGVP